MIVKNATPEEATAAILEKLPGAKFRVKEIEGTDDVEIVWNQDETVEVNHGEIVSARSKLKARRDSEKAKEERILGKGGLKAVVADLMDRVEALERG